MLLRRFPIFKKHSPEADGQFHQKLVRTVLFVLLLASMFPVVLIGTLTYYRSRSLLRNQTAQQMEIIFNKEKDRLDEFVASRESLLEQIAVDPVFNANLTELINLDRDTSEYSSVRSRMYLQFQIYFDYRTGTMSNTDITSAFFDELLIVNNEGEYLISTDDTWLGTNFGTQRINSPYIRDLIGTNSTIMFNDPQVIPTNHLVIISTRSFTNEKGENVATIFNIGSTPLSSQILADAGAFFKDANAFLFTPNKILLAPATGDRLEPATYDPGLMLHINPMIHNQSTKIFFEAQDINKVGVMIYAQWMSEYGLGLAILVPQEFIYQQVRILDGFNVVMLLLSMILTSGLIYLGSTSLVNPLVHLANIAENFSKGNWKARAEINRKDEIGLLAHSFNAMADDLSELYHSLETVVEKRTSQLRTASEVAQLATSSTGLEKTLSSTVDLIAERFGYYHAAIYLMDETARTVILSEATGPSGEQMKMRGDRIDVGSNTLIGWVAQNNLPRVVIDVEDDEIFRPDPALPDTHSEVAIPITINQEVLGVLDIQSTLVNAFDSETVAVLQTLANQISTTLQNNRLLETAQVNYQETTLLYRTTRQVTQAHNEDEVYQIMGDSLIQLPYVSSVLSVEEDHLEILMLTDNKTGKIERNMQGIIIPMRNLGETLVENRVVLIEDVNQTSDYDNILSFLLRRGCKMAALLSILEGGRLSKVLVLGSRDIDQITHSSLQPYANLAEVIGASLEKFRVLTTLQQRLSELQIMASVSDAITVEIDLPNLYKVLHNQVMQTIGSDINFAIALYNAEKNQIELPYHYASKDHLSEALAPFPLGEGLTSYVIQKRKPLLISKNVEQIARQMGAKFVGQPARSWLGIPLLFGGEVVGALILQDLDREEAFTENDKNLFMTLAPQIATAIRNAQLITTTQEALSAYDQEHFLLNMLLDHSPDVIAFKDKEGRYIRASQSITRTYNIDLEEIIGRSDQELLEGKPDSLRWDKEGAVMEGKKPITSILDGIDPVSGRPFWIQITGIPIFSGLDELYGTLIIQRDITDLKITEALAQRRAEQMLTAAEIARDTTGTLEVETLLKKSVNLVRERYGFYHASIFLLDQPGENAILRESTGLAGEQMMASGHRLAVGSRSIVGQVTAQGKALVVNDVILDPNYYPNPLLPETRSELAIPLKVGERILGALDVQSTTAGAFLDEDISILQILADQMAVAVVNGELFAKTQELLVKHRLLRQITVAASTTTTLEDALINVVKGLRTSRVGERVAILMLNSEGFLQTQASAGYEGTAHLEARVAVGKGITGLAASEKHPVRVDNTDTDPRYVSVDPEVRSELAIPILFSEELIGILNLESSDPSAFDENDEEILGALGNNLGGVIANIRLVQQVTQQVERERLLFEITSKIRRSVDLETILETSTREICRALGARKARIHITAGKALTSPDPIEKQFPEDNHHSDDNGHHNGRKNGRSGAQLNDQEVEQ